MKKQINEARARITVTEKYLEHLYDYLEIMEMAEKVEKAVIRYSEKYEQEEVNPVHSNSVVAIGKAIANENNGDYFNGLFERLVTNNSKYSTIG